MGIKIELLEDKTDFCPKAGEIGPTILQGHIIDNNFAFLNRFKPVDTPYQGAFPRAAGATDYHYLSRINLEIDIPENMELVEPFIYFLESNHRLAILWKPVYLNRLGEYVKGNSAHKTFEFVTSSLVDKVSKVCEGLSILNSLIIDMKTRHKKDKIPLDGDRMSLDFHKYHALGNDYIVIDPNETKAKLPAHPVKTGQARLELPGDVDMITGSALPPTPAYRQEGGASSRLARESHP